MVHTSELPRAPRMVHRRAADLAPETALGSVLEPPWEVDSVVAKVKDSGRALE